MDEILDEAKIAEIKEKAFRDVEKFTEKKIDTIITLLKEMKELYNLIWVVSENKSIPTSLSIVHMNKILGEVEFILTMLRAQVSGIMNKSPEDEIPEDETNDIGYI